MEVNMLAIYIIFGLMIVLGLVALLISLLPGGVGSVRSRQEELRLLNGGKRVK